MTRWTEGAGRVPILRMTWEEFGSIRCGRHAPTRFDIIDALAHVLTTEERVFLESDAGRGLRAVPSPSLPPLLSRLSWEDENDDYPPPEPFGL